MDAIIQPTKAPPPKVSSPRRKTSTTWLLSNALIALFTFSMLRNTATVSLKLSILSNLDIHFDTGYDSATVTQNVTFQNRHSATAIQRKIKRVVRWNLDDATVTSQEFLYPAQASNNHTQSSLLSFTPFRTNIFPILPVRC